MKNEIMYEAITEIRADMIEEAESYQFKRKANWAKWGSMAASIVLLVSLGLYAQVKSALNEYAGPVLPLTTLSDTTGIVVERNITLDFSPYREFNGKSDNSLWVKDKYVLYNETDEDVSLALIYGFIGSLSDDLEFVPDIYYEGEMLETDLLIGEVLQEYDDWQSYESLLSNNQYLEKALESSTIEQLEEKIDRDNKSEFYSSKRVMYHKANVFIPANSSITLNINSSKVGADGRFDIMTTLGSAFKFKKQTASIQNMEIVKIKEQDFDFQLDKNITEVELDGNKSCFSISVEKLNENVWRTLKKQGYNVIPKPKADSIECQFFDDRVFVNVYGIEEGYYQKYVNKCINRYKFDIALEQKETSISAFNSEGYYLIIINSFDPENGEMLEIFIKKPIMEVE